MSTPKTNRVAVYFDGLNVMHRLRDSGWEEAFDVGLAARRIARNRSLEGVYYFTSKPSVPPIKTQGQYWKEVRHLKKVEVQLYEEFGRYVRYGYMAKHDDTWEEKKTDVWIASQMVADAWMNVYDTAILLTADADLLPTIEILNYFDKGTELVVFPKSRLPSQLVEVAGSVTKARRGWFQPYP